MAFIPNDENVTKPAVFMLYWKNAFELTGTLGSPDKGQESSISKKIFWTKKGNASIHWYHHSSSVY